MENAFIEKPLKESDSHDKDIESNFNDELDTHNRMNQRYVSEVR